MPPDIDAIIDDLPQVGAAFDDPAHAALRNEVDFRGTAGEHRAAAIAFPSISTGAYGFPVERACRIALREISAFLQDNPLPERVAGADLVPHLIKLAAERYQKPVADRSSSRYFAARGNRRKRKWHIPVA